MGGWAGEGGEEGFLTTDLVSVAVEDEEEELCEAD